MYRETPILTKHYYFEENDLTAIQEVNNHLQAIYLRIFSDSKQKEALSAPSSMLFLASATLLQAFLSLQARPDLLDFPLMAITFGALREFVGSLQPEVAIKIPLQSTLLDIEETISHLKKAEFERIANSIKEA